ncbi:MAG: hypothetical protein IV100_23740, partial [Myxococcales bacterium]|nr:hypothetical protein [Myxococcales bacterium]
MSDDDIDDKLVQQHHDDDDIGDDDDDASQPVGQLSDLQLQALEQKLVDAPFNYELHQVTPLSRSAIV